MTNGSENKPFTLDSDDEKQKYWAYLAGKLSREGGYFDGLEQLFDKNSKDIGALLSTLEEGFRDANPEKRRFWNREHNANVDAFNACKAYVLDSGEFPAGEKKDSMVPIAKIRELLQNGEHMNALLAIEKDAKILGRALPDKQEEIINKSCELFANMPRFSLSVDIKNNSAEEGAMMLGFGDYVMKGGYARPDYGIHDNRAIDNKNLSLMIDQACVRQAQDLIQKVQLTDGDNERFIALNVRMVAKDGQDWFTSGTAAEDQAMHRARLERERQKKIDDVEKALRGDRKAMNTIVRVLDAYATAAETYRSSSLEDEKSRAKEDAEKAIGKLVRFIAEREHNASHSRAWGR